MVPLSCSSLMDGVILIDKPAGPTSAEVVRQLKARLGKRARVGHLGTLDPFGAANCSYRAARFGDPRCYQPVLSSGVLLRNVCALARQGYRPGAGNGGTSERTAPRTERSVPARRRSSAGAGAFHTRSASAGRT